MYTYVYVCMYVCIISLSLSPSFLSRLFRHIALGRRGKKKKGSEVAINKVTKASTFFPHIILCPNLYPLIHFYLFIFLLLLLFYLYNKRERLYNLLFQECR